MSETRQDAHGDEHLIDIDYESTLYQCLYEDARLQSVSDHLDELEALSQMKAGSKVFLNYATEIYKRIHSKAEETAAQWYADNY